MPLKPFALLAVALLATAAAPARSAPSAAAPSAPASAPAPRPAPHRRALIIGINDYSASKIAGWDHNAPQGRDYASLRAAVNDATAMRELLLRDYGFADGDVVVLLDQQATRAAMLHALDDRLVAPAAKGDIVFFYYAGHGSQVRNSRSDEPDRMDETLVPADSRAGAHDIRDKELRPRFNAILGRGAHLTVMLDNCFSGSGARGYPTDATPRAIAPDRRDVADPRDYGPRPENRGALVLSATQDDSSAFETNERGVYHGTFTWAWLHAVRDSVPGESATETFLRAQARTRAARPYQQPVLAGSVTARHSPFLGERLAPQRARVAVERVQRDGTVVVQGGFANGLDVGSTLRLAADPHAKLTITSMLGLARSEARLEAGTPMPAALQSGALLDPLPSAALRTRALRLAVPRTNASEAELSALAQRLHRAATKRGIRWVRDPIDETPSHVLRRDAAGWELVHRGRRTPLGGDGAAVATIARLPLPASLFVQFAAHTVLAEAVDVDGVEGDADYLLAGRYVDGRLTYAWIRPGTSRRDRAKSPLPLRSAWTRDAARLRDALGRIRKVFNWQTLESPVGDAFAYRLALRRERDGELARDGILRGGDRYQLLLRAAAPLPATSVPRRFVYVFAIDSDGRGVLLFPQSGSVENHFPLASDAPPAEVPLARIGVSKPYGLDTYFLVTSDEPLPDPWILAWDGIRAGAAAPWSVEKKTFESVPPDAESASRATRCDLSCLPNRRSENRSRVPLSSAATTTSSRAPCAASRRSPTAASRRRSRGRSSTASR